MTPPVTWLVGAGGLLGTHVAEALARRGVPRLDAPPVPWGDPDEARAVLARTAASLVHAADGGAWQVIWCAGAGVVGTSAEQFADELDALRAALSGLEGAPRHTGCLFLASSAGAVYAGVGAPPYTEDSPVAPLADYGRAKLAAEDVVTQWGAAHGVRVLIGRISNLYGPGQNLAKAQGLVSQLCAGYLRRRPNFIWSSLDTLRDYIFAPDCAALLLDGLDRLRTEPGPDSLAVTKILATGHSMTIGEILGELRHVFRRRPQIVLGASPASALQARDLSMASVVWPELDRRTWTPFPVGALVTLSDLRVSFGTAGPPD